MTGVGGALSPMRLPIPPRLPNASPKALCTLSQLTQLLLALTCRIAEIFAQV